jgi:large subunit ribosomal protein L21
MFAVIKTGGKQYRVSPGDMLIVEKLDGAPGDEIRFDQVMMLGEGEQITVGAPMIDGGLVRAVLVETRKGEKIKIFKKKRRQGYRRTGGHRQIESVLRVTGWKAPAIRPSGTARSTSPPAPSSWPARAT